MQPRDDLHSRSFFSIKGRSLSQPAPPLRRAPPGLVALWLALVPCIGVLDVWTGTDLSMSLFYIVPIVAAAHLHGMLSALSVASAASVMWFVADYAPRVDPLLWLALWNATTRAAIFVGVGWLTARVADDRLELGAAWRREHSLSRTDGLTGLANARALYEACNREIARARRGGGFRCAVLFIDLDNFKSINDIYGHAAGDAVLRGVGEVLTTGVRGTDVAARMGGDEFVLVLWSASLEEAHKVGERIVSSVAQLGEQYPDAALGASVGISGYVEAPEDTDVMLRHADEALYEAKRANKGRVMLSDATAIGKGRGRQGA